MSQHIDLFLPSRESTIRVNKESREIELSSPIAPRDIFINLTSEHLPVAHSVKIDLPFSVSVSAFPKIYKLAQAGISHNIGVSAAVMREQPANPEQEGE